MTVQLTIPRLPDPQRYTGLYLIRFAHGTAVGYLAEEVAILLGTDAYRDMPVFRIHRVDRSGRLEMIGVTAADLAGESALVFASSDPAHASRQFAELRRLANARPLPSPARIELVDLSDLPAPHAVCLIYQRHASTMVSDWLLKAGFDGGDQVLGGQEAANARHRAAGAPVATAMLAACSDHTPRCRDELLASVEEPLQR